MTTKLFHLALASAVALTAAPVLAGEFTGGDIDLSYSAFTDDTDYAKAQLDGSFEYGINRSFGVQVDGAAAAFGFIDETGSNVTLHGIWHTGTAGSAGIFVGSDRIDGESTEFYGLEYGMDVGGGFGVEGYAAFAEDHGEDGALYGIKGEYAFANTGFSVAGTLDYLDLDSGISATKLGVTGNYALSPTGSIYAEVGNVNLDIGPIDDNEAYVGVGARIHFGAARGATFDRRGLIQLLPGL